MHSDQNCPISHILGITLYNTSHIILYDTIRYCTRHTGPYCAVLDHPIPDGGASCSRHTIPSCPIPYHTVLCNSLPFYAIPYHTVQRLPYHMQYHAIPLYTTHHTKHYATLFQVVARVPLGGVERRVSVRLLSVVLLLEAGNHRLRIDHGILWLHARHCAHLLFAHGQQRVLRLFLVSTMHDSNSSWLVSRTSPVVAAIGLFSAVNRNLTTTPSR